MSSVCYWLALGVVAAVGIVKTLAALPLQPSPLPTLAPPRRYLEPSFDKDAKVQPWRPPPPNNGETNNFYNTNTFKDQDTRNGQIETNNVQPDILDPYKKNYIGNYDYEGYFPKEDDQSKSKDQEVNTAPQDYTDQFKKVYYTNSFDNYLTQVDTNIVQENKAANEDENNNVDLLNSANNNKYPSQTYVDKPLVSQYQLNSPQAVNYPVDQSVINQYLQNSQPRKVESMDKPTINLYPTNPSSSQPINYSVDKSGKPQYQQNPLPLNHQKDQTNNQYLPTPQTLNHPIEHTVTNQYLQNTPQAISHTKETIPATQFLPNSQQNHIKEQLPLTVQTSPTLNHPSDQSKINQYIQPHTTPNGPHSKDQAPVNQYLTNSYLPVDSAVPVPQYLQPAQPLAPKLDQPVVNQFLQPLSHSLDQTTHQTLQADMNQYQQTPDTYKDSDTNSENQENESKYGAEFTDETSFVEDDTGFEYNRGNEPLTIPLTDTRGVLPTAAPIYNTHPNPNVQNIQPFKPLLPNQPLIGALQNGKFAPVDMSENEIKYSGWDPRYFPSKQAPLKIPQPIPTKPFWAASQIFSESTEEKEIKDEEESKANENNIEEEDELENVPFDSEREIFTRTTTITKTTTWYLNHDNEIVVKEQIGDGPQKLKGKYKKTVKTITSGPIPWYLQEFEDLIFEEENEQGNILDKVKDFKGMTPTSISSFTSKPNSWSSEINEEVAFEGVAFEEDGVDNEHKLHYSGPHQLPCGHIVELQLVNPQANQNSENFAAVNEGDNEMSSVAQDIIQNTTPFGVGTQLNSYQSEVDLASSILLQLPNQNNGGSSFQTTNPSTSSPNSQEIDVGFQDILDNYAFKDNQYTTIMPYTSNIPKPLTVSNGIASIDNTFSHTTVAPTQFQDPTHQQSNFKNAQSHPQFMQFGNLPQQGNRRDLQSKPKVDMLQDGGLHQDKWQIYQNLQQFQNRLPRTPGQDL